MGRLLGCMANRADRLAEILEEERAAVAPSADFRPDAWGLGFYQGGEVLHKKRPQLEGSPVDWADIATGVSSDAVVIHFREATVGDFRAENTHPFRMRQWLFAHNGTVHGFRAIRERMLEAMPDFLRRNLQGATDSEHVFHVVLSFLHDAGQLDHPDADPKIMLGAVRSSIALLDRHAAEVGAPEPGLNLLLTNGRSMLAVRRDAPLYYVERKSLPSEAGAGKGKGGSLRYVLLSSAGADAPAGYSEVPSRSALLVDRQLTVKVVAL